MIVKRMTIITILQIMDIELIALDRPTSPFISLVNEGRLVISWDQSGKSRDQFIIAAWKEFGGAGELPRPNWSDRNHPFNRFDEWVNLRVWEKCTAFLRSFGCKALLSNDNDGAFHGEGEGLTPRYDYVDNHFYIDLPKFLERSWSLPSRRDNVNPIKKGEPEIFNKGWAKGSSKPYTITEWNFAGPGRYRAMLWLWHSPYRQMLRCFYRTLVPTHRPCREYRQ